MGHVFTKGTQRVAQLEEWCGELGIDVPPVPEELAATLGRVSPHAFATRLLPWSPYRVEDWVTEAERESVPDYLVVGHAGHGVNSYGVSYFLVHQNLRLFIQVGLGGAYMDAEQARRSVGACFKGAGELIHAAASASSRCVCLSPMIVVATEFYGSRWSAPTNDGDREPTEVTDSASNVGAVHECILSATTWIETCLEAER